MFSLYCLQCLFANRWSKNPDRNGIHCGRLVFAPGSFEMESWFSCKRTKEATLRSVSCERACAEKGKPVSLRSSSHRNLSCLLCPSAFGLSLLTLKAPVRFNHWFKPQKIWYSNHHCIPVPAGTLTVRASAQHLHLPALDNASIERLDPLRRAVSVNPTSVQQVFLTLKI